MLNEIVTASNPSDPTPVAFGPVLRTLFRELFGLQAGNYPASLTSTASLPVTFCGVIFQSFAQLSSAAGGTPTMKTTTLPGGALSVTTGRAIRIRAWGVVANNANGKTLLLKFGGTTLATITVTASVANAWYFDAIVAVRTATTQTATCWSMQGTGTPTYYINDTAPGETLSGDIVVQVTGTQTSGADLVQNGMLVEYIA